MGESGPLAERVAALERHLKRLVPLLAVLALQQLDAASGQGDAKRVSDLGRVLQEVVAVGRELGIDPRQL